MEAAKVIQEADVVFAVGVRFSDRGTGNREGFAPKAKIIHLDIDYAEQGKLYIAEGYGPQPTSGYSVEVEAVYETRDAVYIHTNLLGPEKGEETKEVTTYPYVVIQMEYIEKDVLFD